MNNAKKTPSKEKKLLKLRKSNIYYLLKIGVIQGIQIGNINITREELIDFFENKGGL